MHHLTLKTEYSFRRAYGKVTNILDILKDNQEDNIAGVCDRNGTWGHIAWHKECIRRGITPVLGVELACVEDADERSKQPFSWVKFLAHDLEGFRLIHELVKLATEKFYYIPRIDVRIISELFSQAHLSGIIDQYAPKELIRPGFYGEWGHFTASGVLPRLLTDRNYFPTTKDREAYSMVSAGFNLMMGFTEKRNYPQHVMREDEFQMLEGYDSFHSDFDRALRTTNNLAKSIKPYDLPQARLPKFKSKKTLRQLCEAGAKRLGITLEGAYKDRLNRELKVIEEKKFEDYFFIVRDMIQEASKFMAVGPGRGSAAGSLVCFLLGITDVIDPIEYDLLFERFIDENRTDFPDIDVDFSDSKREKVFKYLVKKYGADNVSKLGSISTFKPKAALQDVSKRLKIQPWEFAEFKNNLIERSAGDDRASQCIEDTFETTEIGKELQERHPDLTLACQVEGKIRQSSVHAAGILVSSEPLTKYVSVDSQSKAAQIDKWEAEEMNLLKIDALGLTTLSIIEECLESESLTYQHLKEQPLDSVEAFDVLNNGQFAGIFQFEGDALKKACSKIKVESFNDLIALTSLARPGPMNSGATELWIKRKKKGEDYETNPLLEDITRDTYGVLVYQEQIMRCCREIGLFSWPDVHKVRKGIGKSLGEEFINRYKDKFITGALSNKLSEEEATDIWNGIVTMGKYAFNKSHAATYSVISYWCCLLKARYPESFALAVLNHAKEDKTIKVLRELDKEGWGYVPYDRHVSTNKWVIHEGRFCGPLTGIHGIGKVLCNNLVKKREEGGDITARQEELLENGETKWDNIFECRDLWGHVKDHPKRYNIVSNFLDIEEIESQKTGTYLFIVKIISHEVRDKNSPAKIRERGGKVHEGPSKYVVVKIADDTDEAYSIISTNNYDDIGILFSNQAKEGDFYLLKANKIRDTLDLLFINRAIRLTNNDKFLPS